MSGITQNTLARIDKWLSYGTSMQTAFPKLEQRYRMEVCSEFYKRWVQNKDIDPRTVCRNIARRDYELFFNQAAQGNNEAQEYVLALKITLDNEGNICPRTVTELNNDVLVCNYLIRFFQTDESPRHKAMYLSSAEWLIRTGKQQNNDRAVDKGMQALSNVYGNFQEEKDATDEMPDMSRIAITQDVSIVKRDRINYGHIAPFFNMPHRHPRLQKLTFKAKGTADKEVHQIVLPIGGNIRYFFHQLPCPPNAVLGKGGTHIVTAGRGAHLAAARFAHL